MHILRPSILYKPAHKQEQRRGLELINLSRKTVCRLCLKSAECIYEGVEDVIEMLGTFGLKLDLDITKDPVICASCNNSLHSCISFIKNCFETEESGDRLQVISNNKLYFGSENISDYKISYFGIDWNKNCNDNQLCDEIKIGI